MVVDSGCLSTWGRHQSITAARGPRTEPQSGVQETDPQSTLWHLHQSSHRGTGQRGISRIPPIASPHQGIDGVDADVPTRVEAQLLRGRLSKLLWLLFQGLAYALRPLLLMPLAPNRWMVLNFIVQAVFELALYHFWGAQALAYLPISTLIVMGWHPIAGHYIAEHYVFAEGQETYSYYGPLNRLTFNVGYHNEHHDFPYIADSRLPELRRLAPEFYEPLMTHASWTKVLWDFVMRADVDGTSRGKRRPA